MVTLCFPSAAADFRGLNESPSEKEGKSVYEGFGISVQDCLNESPSEKEGK